MRIFSIIGLIGIISIGYNDSTSALTYQSSVTNSFTINESVSIKLSSSELKIDSLTPGQSADSNVITITTESNAGKFTLSSTVGNSTYNTTDLVQSDVDDKFSILSSSGDLDFGKWGFSFATEGSGENWTNWSPYNGLPKYDNESADPVNLVTDANAKTTIAFKIGAKASASQAAGEYNNVINFIATATPNLVTPCSEFVPGMTNMQEFATMSSSDKATVFDKMTMDKDYKLTDSRDGKSYCVTKMQDGHIWMTQNLDLDLSTSTELKHADTDLGWGTDTATTTWTPTRNTISAVTNSETAGSITRWTNNDTAPYSVDSGDWYWKNDPFQNGKACRNNDSGTWADFCNYITKAADQTQYTNYFSTTPYESNGSHGHVGNYYNWTAAIASNGSSSYKSSTLSNIANNPQNSICPAGWRLPTIYGSATTDDTKNEFYTLNKLYNDSKTDTSENLEASPLFFVRGGYVNNGTLLDAGYDGGYWSSTVNSSSTAYLFAFNSSSVSPVIRDSRYCGRSVRCIVR